MSKRWCISYYLFLILLIPSLATAGPKSLTRILVDKSDHLLHVFVKDKKVATFRVGFGTRPQGHKQQEGDKRTPEGWYVLDFKKADSAYFRAFHISYPNAADRARAKQLGVSPGGDVMIHGEPNNPLSRAAVLAYPSPDWTDGCIALSNADMQRLWDMVSVPTPIEIVP